MGSKGVAICGVLLLYIFEIRFGLDGGDEGQDGIESKEGVFVRITARRLTAVSQFDLATPFEGLDALA